MKLSHIGVIIIGLSSMISLTPFAANVEAGKTKSGLCAGCHGPDGNSFAATWPKLAGQHASYLVKQLKEYKAGIRVDPTMQGMAATLDDQGVEDVAAYFASQTPKPVDFDKTKAALGESIYRGGITQAAIPACMACHGPDGGGNAPAKYPSLKSQHADYTVAQLRKFKDGSRSNDAGKMMRNIAKRMTEDEMSAVAAYIASLQ